MPNQSFIVLSPGLPSEPVPSIVMRQWVTVFLQRKTLMNTKKFRCSKRIPRLSRLLTPYHPSEVRVQKQQTSIIYSFLPRRRCFDALWCRL
jgi:hypothetical protein